ncbi:protein TEX261 [Euwallacea fornicatus]|uniref:protein TEX261 n=1 Tax=Euwallacea fornicatus TaxID=995702 RepID=UPI0033902F48
MWFLTLICYLSILAQVVFITVSIASGLYYIAELVEEYSSIAKKVIWWMNVTVTSLYICLWLFENFPTVMIICGILAQVCHFMILSNFPFVAFSSPQFIFGMIFVLVNHYFAFSYFSSTYHPFSEVIAYFTLYLWLVPFALFVSLSANDNVLPTTTDLSDVDVVSSYISKRNRKYGLLTLFSYAKESLLPMRTKKGF